MNTALAETPPNAQRVSEAIVDMRDLAIRALRRMYLQDQGLYAFCLRRTDQGDRLEGISRRYTAIVLLALADEAPDVVAQALPTADPHDLCGRLIDHTDRADDIGEVALTLWAARAFNHPGVDRVHQRLAAMDPVNCSSPTVEVAWALTSLVVRDECVDRPLADAVANRLMSSFDRRADLFPHWPIGAAASAMRAHVACFADLVYPIQALSYYYRATQDQNALALAQRCARRMCELQGEQGQWWWHYDARTGHVLERFPVYAVHQDAMAPMALFALQDACGEDHTPAVIKGVEWLLEAPEISGSLIDRAADVIWRKVARHEPGKMARSVQAAASRVHPALRVPGVDLVFPPGSIDYESRPYHMGWLLHAFSGPRATGLGKRCRD
jgi:hypothetical protein